MIITVSLFCIPQQYLRQFIPLLREASWVAKGFQGTGAGPSALDNIIKKLLRHDNFVQGSTLQPQLFVYI